MHAARPAPTSSASLRDAQAVHGRTPEAKAASQAAGAPLMSTPATAKSARRRAAKAAPAKPGRAKARAGESRYRQAGGTEAGGRQARREQAAAASSLSGQEPGRAQAGSRARRPLRRPPRPPRARQARQSAPADRHRPGQREAAQGARRHHFRPDRRLDRRRHQADRDVLQFRRPHRARTLGRAGQAARRRRREGIRQAVSDRGNLQQHLSGEAVSDNSPAAPPAPPFVCAAQVGFAQTVAHTRSALSGDVPFPRLHATGPPYRAVDGFIDPGPHVPARRHFPQRRKRAPARLRPAGRHHRGA